MKKILSLTQQFLRRYPAPTSIFRIGDLLNLTYTYSSPYTNSKHKKEELLPLINISCSSVHQTTIATLIYNEKGFIQQAQSFDSILVKDKHEKVLDDFCFGRGEKNKEGNRWVYIAEVKTESLKSYFNGGQGKKIFVADFGEGYDDVKEAGIFLWDKSSKKVYRVKLDKNLIPAHVSFASSDGSQIIFHAYKRQSFGYGILHCVNRPVAIYHAKLSLEQKISKNEQNNTKLQQPQLQLNAEICQLIKDCHQTNMYPRLSPCFNYLVYLSGTGITHTYYLDLVINKRHEGQWKQTHRLKERVVGFQNTLKPYTFRQDNLNFAIFQSPIGSDTHIFKINLQTAEQINLTKEFKHHDFTISDVQDNGFMTGIVTTNNYHTFFYGKENQVEMVKPREKEAFEIKQYNTPIHGVLVTAKKEDIEIEFQSRVAKRPVVMILHGGPHGSFLPAHTSLRYTLLKMGYALLMPNFPGSIGYGQKYIDSLLKGIGEYDVKPILQLLDLVLQENSDLDSTKVHVQGGSYGGYLSALLGSRHAEKLKSAVILNGVLNNGGEMWFTDIPEWVVAQTLGRKDLHSLTQQDYVQFWRQSAGRDPMKIPTLQFLGAKDRRVPYRQGLFFDAITKEVGTPITTYVYENSNHNLADSVDTSIDITVKTVAFLEEIKDDKNE